MGLLVIVILAKWVRQGMLPAGTKLSGRGGGEINSTPQYWNKSFEVSHSPRHALLPTITDWFDLVQKA